MRIRSATAQDGSSAPAESEVYFRSDLPMNSNHYLVLINKAMPID
ncbi:hypothetical protein [Oceanobacillus chungangensis]|nr:hypothetical protein [Oceanobacillus chungangensis]